VSPSPPPLAVHRSGSGAPLVLVHGDFNDARQAWRRQLERPGGFDMLAVDRRGYGASVPAEPPFTIAGDAAEALEVATLAGFDRFTLAGHSYGGVVAIEMARRAPERVTGLVLVEPPHLALLPDHPEVTDLRGAVAELWRAHPGMTDEELATAFFSAIAGPEETARMKASRGWGKVVAQARRAVQAESPERYPASAVEGLRRDLPVVILTGGRSNPGLQAIAHDLAARIPGARLLVSPEAGHAVQFDEALFADALRLVSGDGRSG